VPRNNRGRIPLELNDEVNEVRGPTEKAANAPRCHNYRWSDYVVLSPIFFIRDILFL
jgi:hypothetical protein